MPKIADAQLWSAKIDVMKRITLALGPMLAVAALWAYVSLNSERFPDPVAIHWGVSGEADGFASLESHLALTSITLVLVGLLWTSVVLITRIPRPVKLLFLVIVGALWLLLFLLFAYTFAIQIDLADARDADLSIGVLIAMLVLPVALLPWVFAKPRIEVGERLKVLYWGIPLLNVGYSDIASVGTDQVRARDFGGLGIRYANKTTAFMPSAGLALELRLAAGERILVRTDQAAELARQIDNARGNH